MTWHPLTPADVAAHLIRQRDTTGDRDFIAAYLTNATQTEYDRTVTGVTEALRRYYDSPCDGCGGPIGLHPWTTEHPHGVFRSYCSRTCMDARRVFGSGVHNPARSAA